MSSNSVHTYHLHIKGVVQGVGFRPFVYRLASEMGIHGTVSNTSDGVHVNFNAEKSRSHDFVDAILREAPDHARIRHHELSSIDNQKFSDFSIIDSSDHQKKEVLLTPDLAMCRECRDDIDNTKDRRQGYAFTTCTNCGPRFSIIEALPYDREHTTMKTFAMCPKCQKEYANVLDRRYYSQTNSCPDCAIRLSLLDEKGRDEGIIDQEEILNRVIALWNEGAVIAIKGIGGYLITCDATRPEVVRRLRSLKGRPSKPFAVMYEDLFMMAEDVDIDSAAMLALESSEAPIVLLNKKADPWSEIAFEDVAPGLSKVGVMLPYTPLYHLLLRKFKKPIIATSGNLSGDPIEYRDELAIKRLSGLVDAFLTNDRPIVVPQDDSVVSLSPISRQNIILRRSRGLSPVLLSGGRYVGNRSVLAMGGLLKSTVCLSAHSNLYMSQYLGDTDSLNTQENYSTVLDHLLGVTGATPEAIICDKHPSFFSSRYAEPLAEKMRVPLVRVQHHEAHFMAILGEKDLLHTDRRVMGVIWDGTGLGDDGNIWGGETFSYKSGKVDRIKSLPGFRHITRDKMSREPRISALSLTRSYGLRSDLVEGRFSETELDIYNKLLEKDGLTSTSMGRVFDAVAAVVGGFDIQTYEGEAAMRLEDMANRYFRQSMPSLEMSYLEVDQGTEELIFSLISHILEDRNKGVDPELIAARFHVSLVDCIDRQAKELNFDTIAFSGGVFQNTWLVELIRRFLGRKYELLFHEEMSPNDENISFGQIMYYFKQHRI